MFNQKVEPLDQNTKKQRPLFSPAAVQKTTDILLSSNVGGVGSQTGTFLFTMFSKWKVMSAHACRKRIPIFAVAYSTVRATVRTRVCLSMRKLLLFNCPNKLSTFAPCSCTKNQGKLSLPKTRHKKQQISEVLKWRPTILLSWFFSVQMKLGSPQFGCQASRSGKVRSSSPATETVWTESLATSSLRCLENNDPPF